MYKVFNGGNRIEKATNGEYFVGTDVEYKGGDDYVSYKRRFDWSGRSKENGGGKSGGGSLFKGLGGMFNNTGANVPNRRLTDYSLRLSNNHYGSYIRHIEEQLRSIGLYGRNINYEIGIGASLMGGFGGGVGIVFDELGEWKLYWTAEARVGLGGNVGLSVNRITPGEGQHFLNSDGTFEGYGTEFAAGEGPAAFSKGRNFLHKRGDSTPLWKKIGNFWGQGENYTTQGLGIEIPLVEDIFGPAAAKSAPKLQPSINLGAELKYTYTKFFF